MRVLLYKKVLKSVGLQFGLAEEAVESAFETSLSAEVPEEACVASGADGLDFSVGETVCVEGVAEPSQEVDVQASISED